MCVPWLYASNWKVCTSVSVYILTCNRSLQWRRWRWRRQQMDFYFRGGKKTTVQPWKINYTSNSFILSLSECKLSSSFFFLVSCAFYQLRARKRIARKLSFSPFSSFILIEYFEFGVHVRTTYVHRRNTSFSSVHRTMRRLITIPHSIRFQFVFFFCFNFGEC